MHFYCEKCKKKYPLNTLTYHCSCGGLFKLYKTAEDIIPSSISIGEIKTPMLAVNFDDFGKVFLKLEHLQTTGSFKARGAYALINELKYLGISHIVEDSSGNSGAAISAYAAAAGIDCDIYVPKGIAESRVKFMKTFGTHVHYADNRIEAGKAARRAAEKIYYASHIYNPLFFEGIKTLAYEIYEQMGNKVPEYIFVPVGNGTILLGLYYGFEEIGRLPAFVAVQSESCSPVYSRFKHRKLQPESYTIASAIRIMHPKRINEILMILQRSLGNVVTVSDDEIHNAQLAIGRKGIYVEESAACSLAGALKFFKKGKPDNYRIVLPLTGAGLLS
ncbi:pyridoxal-phosphate dependent enzyme [Pectinatus sottacetonis]|uniref:pyridoxal-phosphate dependent enzyme n=1 Tax=Pectinatus sottacetonis TaxID=1002795 RepID=UPI0018C49A7B|nr:pyridoxal-phosphate dependent enzyme [Pectinatus sottacetonis]